MWLMGDVSAMINVSLASEPELAHCPGGTGNGTPLTRPGRQAGKRDCGRHGLRGKGVFGTRSKGPRRWRREGQVVGDQPIAPKQCEPGDVVVCVNSCRSLTRVRYE